MYTPYTIRVNQLQQVDTQLQQVDTHLTNHVLADILIVGGGGGGGGGQLWGCGGSGGGGGVKFISGELLQVEALFNLRVGAGGIASQLNSTNRDGSVGYPSSFGDNKFIAWGGGGGGSVLGTAYDVSSQGLVGSTNGGVGCAKSTDFTNSTGNGGACVGSVHCTDHNTELTYKNMAYCGGGGGSFGPAIDPIGPEGFCSPVTLSKGGPGHSFSEFGEIIRVGGGGGGSSRDYQIGESSDGGGTQLHPDGARNTGGGGVGGGGSPNDVVGNG